MLSTNMERVKRTGRKMTNPPEDEEKETARRVRRRCASQDFDERVEIAKGVEDIGV